MKTKKSFLLYCDQSGLVNKLSDEQAGKLFKIIYSYCCDGFITPVIDDPLVDLAFTALKSSIDRDHNKYLKVVERNKINGKKGGRPASKPKKPSGLSGNPKNPGKADSDSDSDSDRKRICSRVISYFNKKTGKNYKSDSKVTIEKIDARLNDGFKPENFKTVIDNKVEDFRNGEFKEMYLRPETLFSKKFESYLNQKPINGTNLTKEEILEKHGLSD